MEYSDDRILQLVHEMEPDKREKLLQRLVRENEADKERSIDEWNAILNDKHLYGSDIRRDISWGISRYLLRIRMVTYYIHSIGLMRLPDRSFRSLWRIEEDDERWAPYLEEVAEYLYLAEECVLDLCCLFYAYFIPLAEKDLKLSLEDLNKDYWDYWKQNYDDESARERILRQMSAVKDLAKLYMLQRLDNRRPFNEPYFIDRSYFHRTKDEEKEFWRELIAIYLPSETKRERMVYGPWKTLSTEWREELKFSMRCNKEAMDRKEMVLKAYSLLEQNESYHSIMEQTGISFEEVKALDCFVIKEVDHEA